MNSLEVKTFLFMGRPGSGKGIQARLLKERTGFEIFSTGKQYRSIAGEDTILGRKIKAIIDEGFLAPYWFSVYLFEDTVLNLEAEEGLVLEGSARKKEEAELFHDIFEWLARPYVVFYLDVPESVVQERLQKRLSEIGREDDRPEHFQTRIDEFNTHTMPSINFFNEKGTLHAIDGTNGPQEVHDAVWEIIESEHE